VRTGVAAYLVVTSVLALSATPIQARQASSHVALSATFGSPFSGFGIGLAQGGLGGATAAFFEVNQGPSGLAYGGRHAAHGRRGPRYVGYTCGDVWAALDGPYYHAYEWGLYDDWFYFSDLYGRCILRGPAWAYHRYHAYRPLQRIRSHGPRFVFISVTVIDPYRSWWGPHYVYDPWGAYWSDWVVYRAPAPRVRTVYVTPAVRRPSPIYVANPVFKEDPRGVGTSRTARPVNAPQPSAAPTTSAPAPARTGGGVQAPPRRPVDAGTVAVPRSGEPLPRPADLAPGRPGNAPRATPAVSDSDGSSAPAAPRATPRVDPAPDRPAAPAVSQPTTGGAAAPTPRAPAPTARPAPQGDVGRPQGPSAPAPRAQPAVERELPTVQTGPSRQTAPSQPRQAAPAPRAEPATTQAPPRPRAEQPPAAEPGRSAAPRQQAAPARPQPAPQPDAPAPEPPRRAEPAAPARPAPAPAPVRQAQPAATARPAPSPQAQPTPRSAPAPAPSAQPPAPRPSSAPPQSAPAPRRPPSDGEPR